MTGILQASALQLASSPTRWYVVFTPAEKLHWWDRFFRLKQGFNHVFALRWDGFNWLLFDPHAAFTEVTVLPVFSRRALPSLVPPGATILEVEAFRCKTWVRGRWWIGPMTCVEQIKALLGLQVGFVWTPYQLHQYLLGHTHGRLKQIKRTTPDRAGARTPSATEARVQPVATGSERISQGRGTR